MASIYSVCLSNRWLVNIRHINRKKENILIEATEQELGVFVQWMLAQIDVYELDLMYKQMRFISTVERIENTNQNQHKH